MRTVLLPPLSSVMAATTRAKGTDSMKFPWQRAARVRGSISFFGTEELSLVERLTESPMYDSCLTRCHMTRLERTRR